MVITPVTAVFVLFGLLLLFGVVIYWVGLIRPLAAEGKVRGAIVATLLALLILALFILTIITFLSGS
jgi:hypothetical protein